MNRHSTLVSYLHKLLVLLDRELRQAGRRLPAERRSCRSRGGEGDGGARRTPVTGARIIGGLTPCNVIPDEILTDHPKRFRALLVESGNPAHSLADSPRMREAIAALELVVVIDVAFTETARLAHYVLPVASQFEKAEATFFNFEFPHNYFHLRKALMRAAAGLFSEAELHARLVEALGALPHDAVAALRAAWQRGPAGVPREVLRAGRREPAPARDRAGRCSTARSATCCRRDSPRAPASGRCARSPRSASAQSLARAGFTGEPAEAGDALFDALLASKSAVVFSVDDWEESFARVRHAESAHPARDPRALRRARLARDRAGAGRERRVPVRALGRRAALVHRQHDHPQPRLAPEGPRGRAAHEPRRREARRRRRRRARAALDAARQRRGRGRALGPHAARATSRCRTGSGSTSPTRAARASRPASRRTSSRAARTATGSPARPGTSTRPRVSRPCERARPRREIRRRAGQVIRSGHLGRTDGLRSRTAHGRARARPVARARGSVRGAAAARSRRRGDQARAARRRRVAPDRAAPRPRTVLAVHALERRQALDLARSRQAGRVRRGARAGARVRRGDRELPAGRARSAGRRLGAHPRGEPARRAALDQRLRLGLVVPRAPRLRADRARRDRTVARPRPGRAHARAAAQRLLRHHHRPTRNGGAARGAARGRGDRRGPARRGADVRRDAREPQRAGQRAARPARRPRDESDLRRGPARLHRGGAARRRTSGSR